MREWTIHVSDLPDAECSWTPERCGAYLETVRVVAVPAGAKAIRMHKGRWGWSECDGSCIHFVHADFIEVAP